MSASETGGLIADRYRLQEVIGRGGMGSVHVALDEKFGVRVALKIAATAGANFEQFKARFAREARIGNKLGKSAGFVRAFDWGELPDGVRLYLVMDLVEDAQALDVVSGTLRERVERVLGAARLVAEAHAQGIVHRDIKPANVLQGPDGVLHLTDFGLAKAPGEADVATPGGLTQTGVGMGTPAYMAPEQFDNAKEAGPKADVYSLGIMLYRALTGSFPYEAQEFPSIWMALEKVRTGAEPLPRARDRHDQIPTDLDALCARAMDVDPEARIDSAAFVRELEASLPDPSGPAASAELTLGYIPSPRTHVDTTAPAADPAPPGATGPGTELVVEATAPAPEAPKLPPLPEGIGGFVDAPPSTWRSGLQPKAPPGAEPAPESAGVDPTLLAGLPNDVAMRVKMMIGDDVVADTTDPAELASGSSHEEGTTPAAPPSGRNLLSCLGCLGAFFLGTFACLGSHAFLGPGPRDDEETRWATSGGQFGFASVSVYEGDPDEAKVLGSTGQFVYERGTEKAWQPVEVHESVLGVQPDGRVVTNVYVLDVPDWNDTTTRFVGLGRMSVPVSEGLAKALHDLAAVADRFTSEQAAALRASDQAAQAALAQGEGTRVEIPLIHDTPVRIVPDAEAAMKMGMWYRLGFGVFAVVLGLYCLVKLGEDEEKKGEDGGDAS